jgi:regulator of sirC expression with transglutaminase-like and TPR domain
VTTASRERFAEVVRTEPIDVGLACLLVGAEVEPSLDIDVWLERLDALAATCAPHVARLGPLAGLRAGLAGFAGMSEDFEELEASLLPAVLRRGRGLPLLLSVVWVETAHRIGLAASYATVPGRVLVVLGDLEDDHVLVDAFSGGAVVPGPAEPIDTAALLLRLLTNVRALTARQARSLTAAQTRLWAVELSLLLPRHPMELRRERGELLVRLGRHLDGAAELEAYAAVVADADENAAAEVLREARQARSRLN